MAGARTLAETYRRSGTSAAGTLQGHVMLALSESDEALRAIASLPGRRQPRVVLAALHDLALAGHAPDLAAAYAARDHDAATRAAVDVLARMTDAVAAVTARRRPLGDEAGRFAVLYPAVAEAAHRLGALAVGLVDVGRPAGLNLLLDRVGLTYGDGRVRGDPSSPVQHTTSVVGDRHVPAWDLPGIAARIAVDPDPLDVTDPDDARWLLACRPPDQPERLAALRAEVRLAAADPPLLLLAGRAAAALPAALAEVPPDALPVVTTTWALSRLPAGERARFAQGLEAAASGRTVAWVSAEGVGVAPGIPTLGDRRASGHSILGLALFDGRGRGFEALGRCWARGRLMSWSP